MQALCERGQDETGMDIINVRKRPCRNEKEKPADHAGKQVVETSQRGETLQCEFLKLAVQACRREMGWSDNSPEIDEPRQSWGPSMQAKQRTYVE